MSNNVDNSDVALGVDSPLYFSVHSAYAKLAPGGGALIHVSKYLGTSIQPKPREDQPELEEVLDLMQPGCREVLVKKRPLPNMVSNAVVTATTGGLAGRPDVRIADNLYIVGDWIGRGDYCPMRQSQVQSTLLS
jgi:hypothetical protein